MTFFIIGGFLMFVASIGVICYSYNRRVSLIILLFLVYIVVLILCFMLC